MSFDVNSITVWIYELAPRLSAQLNLKH